ncbi:MAG: branched-chain amino acid aminotransferase [Solirubrobacteraceae bacterium]
MNIQLISESKLGSIDLNKVGFGSDFTDHMFFCDYENGTWKEPSITPYQPIQMSPASHVLHYGQSVFEGMKAYKNQEDEIFLFRPDKNFDRINKSAVRIAMPTIPEEIFFNGLYQLLDIERNWIPSKKGMSLYIRPVLFANEEILVARASQKYKFMIILSVAGSYYENPLRVIIADKYSRSAGGGVGFAKTAGNYAASFYPTNLAKENGFDQIIWTDPTHTKVEEAGTMNLFFRINNTLVTPPSSEKILDGVTRDSIIHLAKHKGIDLEVRDVYVQEIITAFKNNELKEVFGCGTAAVISEIKTIGFPDGQEIEIPVISEELSYAKTLKSELIAIQTNQAADPFGWRVKVEKTLI